MKKRLQIARFILTAFLFCIAFTAQCALSFTTTNVPRTDFAVQNEQVTPYNNNNFTYSVGSGNNLVNFRISVYRPSGTNDEGFVAIYSGNNVKKERSKLTQGAGYVFSYNTGGWTDVRDNTGKVVGQQCAIGSSFDTGYIDIGDVDLYAVLFTGDPNNNNVKQVATSVPIQIRNSGIPGTAPYVVNFAPTQAYAGTSVTIRIGGRNLANVTSITIGNVIGMNVTHDNTYPDNIVSATFTAPAAGAYAIGLSGSNGSSNYYSGVFTSVDPPAPRTLSDFIPCSNVEICSDQCVPYNTIPTLIKGRILADNGDNNFNYFYDNYPDNHFGEGKEHEWTQWQYSTDRIYWYDISNATKASYQPGQLTQTTYFHRVSSHIIPHWYGDTREEWYTSNVVTITVGSAPPVPVQSTYTTCGSGSFTIAVKPAINATSYNWYSKDPSWSINGQGRAVNATSAVSVQITPPAGVANGSYQFTISSNGVCGPKSSDATITVTVGSGTPPASPTSARWYRSSGGLCSPVYGITTPPVSGATSYQATDAYGASAVGVINAAGTAVTFDMREPGPIYGITATVTVSSSCGTASYNIPSSDLAGPADKCNPNAQAQPEYVLYPNPASNQLTIATDGQAADVVFYDAVGVIRKTVHINMDVDQTDINLLDLPPGIYHTKTSISGQAPIEKQLVIRR